jgi:L-ascorbate metabolism protein UlaG (beta-lactamase superfamily)
MINNNIANVIASGSSGNCEIYHRIIAVDMGVPYSKIKPYVNDLQIVLLTHWHADHFNIQTIKKLASERPTLRFGIGEWMAPLLAGIKNIDAYQFGQFYDYGKFQIVMGKCYHDVPNAFYRIFKDGYKIIRATDTSTLEGVTAQWYDLFCIEHSYDEDTVFDKINALKASGQFAYQEGAINSHLSEQKAREFIYKNRGPNSQVLRLHETSLI